MKPTYEVSPCVEHDGAVEPSDQDVAEFWGAYVREGEPIGRGFRPARWLADFTDEQDARDFVQLKRDQLTPLTPPMRTDAAAAVGLMAIYISQGFFRDHWNPPESDIYGGHIGGATVCVAMALRVSRVLDIIQLTYPGIEYPGVFEYEVAERLGVALRARHATDELVAKEIVDFFKRVALTISTERYVSNPNVPRDDLQALVLRVLKPNQ